MVDGAFKHYFYQEEFDKYKPNSRGNQIISSGAVPVMLMPAHEN
jgi:hypothetical protein